MSSREARSNKRSFAFNILSYLSHAQTSDGRSRQIDVFITLINKVTRQRRFFVSSPMIHSRWCLFFITTKYCSAFYRRRRKKYNYKGTHRVFNIPLIGTQNGAHTHRSSSIQNEKCCIKHHQRGDGYRISDLVIKTLDLDDRESLRVKNTKINGDYSFQVLNRIIPESGKRIQLILVPPKPRSVMCTILSFYATHVMYFVSGSIAAYLYYNAVEKREGRKFDIDGSSRHAKANEAIEKWGKRGWMFAEKDERKKKSHTALDCEVVSLQDCYSSALQENGGKELPLWWGEYFEACKVCFYAYSWWENKGRISDIRRRIDVPGVRVGLLTVCPTVS